MHMKKAEKSRKSRAPKSAGSSLMKKKTRLLSATASSSAKVTVKTRPTTSTVKKRPRTGSLRERPSTTSTSRPPRPNRNEPGLREPFEFDDENDKDSDVSTADEVVLDRKTNELFKNHQQRIKKSKPTSTKIFVDLTHGNGNGTSLNDGALNSSKVKFELRCRDSENRRNNSTLSDLDPRRIPPNLAVAQVLLQDGLSNLKPNSAPAMTNSLMGEMCPSPLWLTHGLRVTNNNSNDDSQTSSDSDTDSDSNTGLVSSQKKIPKVNMFMEKQSILKAGPLTLGKAGDRLFKNFRRPPASKIVTPFDEENSPYAKPVKLNYTNRKTMPTPQCLARTELLIDSHKDRMAGIMGGLRQRMENMMLMEKKRDDERSAGFSRYIQQRQWLLGSTASTTVQPYHQSDYVTFTSNSDLSHRAGSNGHLDELSHRNSLPDPVSDHVLHERRRATQGRANSLQTQALRTGRHEKVSRLNSLEPSYSPTERAEKDSLTLNERVQIPDKAPFKQNYFKPLGSRGNSYSVSSVSNNPAVLHQRTGNQSNGRESEENIVAMGTLVGSSNTGTLVGSNNAGTSPGLKSSRSSSGSGGQPHINVQATNTSQHLSQSSSTGVNLNVRKFNCRYNQTSQSPYASGQTNAKQKEDEPRYPDPSLGAPPAFQQRLSELSSLEADTIRQERAKKLKKRSKDS